MKLLTLVALATWPTTARPRRRGEGQRRLDALAPKERRARARTGSGHRLTVVGEPLGDLGRVEEEVLLRVARVDDVGGEARRRVDVVLAGSLRVVGACGCEESSAVVGRQSERARRSFFKASLVARTPSAQQQRDTHAPWP